MFSENEFVFFFEILFLSLVVYKIQRRMSIEPWLSNTEFCPSLLIFEVTHIKMNYLFFIYKYKYFKLQNNIGYVT